jgi:pimeloyl-ACP methyl ester carboxylesterase
MHQRESSRIGYLAGSWPLDPTRPTLVFVHGAGGSRLHWEVQLEALLDVANTLAVDLPGHGRSPGPGLDTVDDYTRVLIDFTDELDPPRPVIVGFSMGGAIAQQALLSHPGKFPAAVLIATGAKLRVLPLVFETIENDYPGYIELKAKMAASPQSDPRLIQPSLEDSARQDPKVVLGDFRACDTFDVRDRLAEIQAPVLVISGEDDLLTPPKFSQYLAEKIKGARRVHLPAAGHLISMEKSAEVNQAIRNFIEDEGF